MGMGMRPVAEKVPDVFGLPVYHVTKTIMRRVGDEIQVLCGGEVFGQMQWHYICVIKANDMFVSAKDGLDLSTSFGPNFLSTNEMAHG